MSQPGHAEKDAEQRRLAELFHFPETNPTTYGRVISTASSASVQWAAVQKREEDEECVALYRKTDGETVARDISGAGFCHQPTVVAADHGGVAVVWNAGCDRGWTILCARFDRDGNAVGDIEEVVSSEGLLLPPAAAFLGATLWVSWPGLDGNRLRIRVAHETPHGWAILPPVSPDAVDAFRPSLAANADGLCVCWDQYRDGAYEVCVTLRYGDAWSETRRLRGEGQRQLAPRVLAGIGDECFVTWLGLREVTDDLGIIDHFPFAMVAQIIPGHVDHLLDKHNPEDPRIVADLREGLLAARTYMGYHGLRRNPQLARAQDGALWCLWEARIEAEQAHLAGHLIGRRWTPGHGWAPPVLLHSGGVGYAVAGQVQDGKLPIACFRYGPEPEHLVEMASVELAAGRPYAVDPRRWDRWQPLVVSPAPKPDGTVAVDGQTYHLFWADTHVHSRFSPDAEGEVDELIHFARDRAGLDAVCVTDNDYYPHKALTEAEWRIQQAFAEHYTEPGRFVVFPGWEYTYHRRDLTPDFNHRIIFYSRPGGPIFRRIDPATRTDRQLFEKLAASDAATYPHHATYEILAPNLDRNVEICSSWRVVFEENDFTLQALNRGQRTGFIGSSDTHRAVPGLGGALTGVFAAELTPEALFEAYRARRLIATQGCFVFIEFRVAGIFIGGEGACDGPPQVIIRIEALEVIEWLEVIRDGQPIRRQAVGRNTYNLAFADHAAVPGPHYYLLRLKLVGDPSFNTAPTEAFNGAFKTDSRYPHNLARAKGPFAWSSPVWITARHT